MRVFLRAITTAALVLLLTGYFRPALAAGGVPGQSWHDLSAAPAFVGRAMGMGPNCPPIQFHVIPMGNNELRGVAFEESPVGAAEMQAFEVSGSMSDNGKITMDLKRLGGGAPPIKVDGAFSGGMLMASINGGSTCHSTSFMLMPVAMPSLPAPQRK